MTNINPYSFNVDENNLRQALSRSISGMNGRNLDSASKEIHESILEFENDIGVTCQLKIVSTLIPEMMSIIDDGTEIITGL